MTREQRKRFCDALRAYAVRHRLDHHALGEQLGYSPKIVGMWLEGQVFPRKPRIEEMCEHFNVSYYAIFEDSMDPESFLNSAPLSYADLQSRYRSSISEDPMKIFRLLSTAAGSIFAQCLMSGLIGRLDIDSSFVCRIRFSVAPLNETAIEIGHSEELGLSLRVVTDNGTVIRNWVAITDAIVKQTLNVLVSQLSHVDTITT